MWPRWEKQLRRKCPMLTEREVQVIRYEACKDNLKKFIFIFNWLKHFAGPSFTLIGTSLHGI